MITRRFDSIPGLYKASVVARLLRIPGTLACPGLAR